MTSVAVQSLKIKPTSNISSHISTLAHLKEAVTVNPKGVGGFGAFSEVPFVLKECNFVDWDTLELDIWIPDHYMNTSNFTL